MSITQYYVCAVHKDKDLYEVFDREDNTICLLNSTEIKTLVKSGKRIDGVSKSGIIALSEQAVKFSNEYKNYLIRYNLAVPFRRDFNTQYNCDTIYLIKMNVGNVRVEYSEEDDMIIPQLLIYLHCIRLKKEVEWVYKIDLSYFYEDSPKSYSIVFDCSSEFRYYLTLAVVNNDFSTCENLIRYYFRDLKHLLKFCKSSLEVINNSNLDSAIIKVETDIPKIK